jgi:hypothetical protein
MSEPRRSDLIDSTEKRWRSLANSVRRTVHFGWAIEHLSRATVVLAILLLPVIVAYRWNSVALDTLQGALLVGIGSLLLFVLFKLRRVSVSESECFALLDSSLAQNNALSAAAAGIAPWPPVPEQIPSPFAFVLKPFTRRAVGALIIALGVALIPARKPNLFAMTEREKPQNVVEVEGWIEKLRRDQIADEEALKSLEKRLETITEQPEERWYDHNSLEAAATLKEQTEQAIRALSSEVDRADGVLEQLSEALSEERSPAELEKLLQNLDQSPGSSTLPLSKELKDQLAELDAKQLGEGKLSELRESLKQKRDALQSMQGQPGQGGQSSDGQNSKGSEGQSGASQPKGSSGGSCPGGGSGPQCSDDGEAAGGEDGQKSGAGKNGEKPGSGGISRGPGTAPLVLKENAAKMTSNRIEALAPSDAPRDDPSDLLGIKSKAPLAEPVPQSGSAGGATTEGGEMATAQQDLTPEEQSLLQRYFR